MEARAMRFGISLALLLAAAPAMYAAEREAKSHVTLLVPAYFYPSDAGLK
jgi:hypothetical protein